MKTTLATEEVEKVWYVIDATDQILGRLAVKIATLLRGRHKPIYTPHMDAGDFVILINADKIKLTGKKMDQKKYMFYSGYRGNEKYVAIKDMLVKRPEFVIMNAVRGMLPKNKLSSKLLTKLRVFKGTDHPHAAQNPIPFNG